MGNRIKIDVKNFKIVGPLILPNDNLKHINNNHVKINLAQHKLGFTFVYPSKDQIIHYFEKKRIKTILKVPCIIYCNML